MRVTESSPANFAQPSTSLTGKRSAQERTSHTDEVTELSIPVLADLMEADRPGRESYLSTLAETVRSGKYSCSPGQVAADILTKGL